MSKCQIEWKTRENVAVLKFLVIDNFDFPIKFVKFFMGKKFVKMLKSCTFYLLTTLIYREKLSKLKVLLKVDFFWEKFDFSSVYPSLQGSFHVYCKRDCDILITGVKRLKLPFDNLYVCIKNALKLLYRFESWILRCQTAILDRSYPQMVGKQTSLQIQT